MSSTPLSKCAKFFATNAAILKRLAEIVPRALPWAVILRPVGAGKEAAA